MYQKQKRHEYYVKQCLNQQKRITSTLPWLGCFLDNLNQIFQTQEVEITWIHCFKFITLKQYSNYHYFLGLYFRKVLSVFNSCVIKSHTYTVDGNFLSSEILQLLWRFWPRQDKLEHLGTIKQCTHPPLTPNCPHSFPPTHQKRCSIHPHSPLPTQNNPHSLKIMPHLPSLAQNMVQ